MNEIKEQDFEQARSDLVELRSALQTVITGQQELISQLIIAFFAEGHCLIEGLPGLGKTQLVKALAGAMGMDFARIQCTPDLMPADITGSDLLFRQGDGNQRFEFQPGPLFSSLVMVDEINRATPKTQSALLEAMQERQVTYSGVTHPLPDPFRLIATQNSIEIEGTYPLPEAQLDRFLLQLRIDYPDRDALLAMLDISLDAEPGNYLQSVLKPQRLPQLVELARLVAVSSYIKQAAVKLLLTTHANGHAGSHHFRYGASPRGLQALIRTARVNALLAGRLQVDIEDLAVMALPVLRHRVLLTMDAELQGLSVDDLLQSLIHDWRETV